MKNVPLTLIMQCNVATGFGYLKTLMNLLQDQIRNLNMSVIILIMR